MKINEIKCKTALSKSNLPGLDYSLNPYRGCEHACVYCYVPNILRIKREEWGGFVNVKTNIANILSKELKKKQKGVVGISTVTDPYQPLEKKYKLTRYCLEQLLRYDFPVHIQTKSDLILRDIDLISKFSNIEVMFSIGTLHDSERKILEPNASSIQQRLNAMKILSENGVKNTVFFGPIYPTIKLEELVEMFESFKKYQVSEVMIDKFNLKIGIVENLSKKLSLNSELENFFIDRVKNDEFYKEIREQIKKEGFKKNIKIVDAF
jgi:DNA repair photolyase